MRAHGCCDFIGISTDLWPNHVTEKPSHRCFLAKNSLLLSNLHTFSTLYPVESHFFSFLN